MNAYKAKVSANEKDDNPYVLPSTYTCFLEANSLASAETKINRWAKREKLTRVKVLSVRDVAVNLIQ